jgi:ParB/RepB/Spo0J family partition protein
MVSINLATTTLLPSGLRFSPEHGVLLAPPSRLRLDPTQPRDPKALSEEELQALRADIDAWRKDGHGLLQTGIMEPLKCRWAPGALGADGNPKKSAQLLVWDGGRRFRVVKDDYDWLPVVLDDLNSQEARSAALRTSIHNKHHSPIEQAHAFAAEAKETGASLRTLAKRYGVDKSFIENRLNLLDAPPDVQRFAAQNPKLMSHALTIRKVKDSSLRSTLMEYARHGAPVRELEAEIQRENEREELKRQSQSAPDAQTAERAAAAARGDNSSVSRGRRVTGISKREATENAAAAATNAAANLETVSQWVEQGATLPRAALMEVRRRIDALLNL